MVTKALKRLLHLDRNEAEVAQVKAETQTRVDQVTAVLKKQGKVQEIVLHKTTTFFIAQAMGLLR